MSENNNIKLDPDVLNQQQNTKVPLSDLYGNPSILSRNRSNGRKGKSK